ncbi:MAG: class I SAM-dependent methyltransferase [Alphaproteobacteria bacterium]|nr:class I SAM-dependent methyltransferase [Alphaproteobacteria bacterium]
MQSEIEAGDATPRNLNGWFGPTFFGVRDRARFAAGLEQMLGTLGGGWASGIFTGDNLITFSKNLSFLEDEAFMAAVARHATNEVERSIVWRTAVLYWAARNGLRRPGDFVECGCYKGTSARILCDALDFGSLPRRYWLYDLFEYPPGSSHTRMPEIGGDLFERTRARFADLPNVWVVKGSVPEVLHAGAPRQVAFLHIDMNAVAPEIGALEFFFDRVVPGGVIVLDDYGYQGYRDQRDAERAWFAARGCHVLELPTSQGLVIR